MAVAHCRGSVLEISTRSYKLMNNLEVLREVRGRLRFYVKRPPSVVSQIWFYWSTIHMGQLPR
jgi:hypothetical protein